MSVSPDPQTEVETQFWMQVAYSGSEPGGWGWGGRRPGEVGIATGKERNLTQDCLIELAPRFSKDLWKCLRTVCLADGRRTCEPPAPVPISAVPLWSLTLLDSRFRFGD